MLNWLLCHILIGHKLEYAHTHIVGSKRTRIFVCLRCGQEIQRKAT